MSKIISFPPPVTTMIRGVLVPKMGRTVTLPTGAHVAWTGGKPHADWSGLETQTEATSPQCVCFPFGTNKESIAHSHRTECKDKGYKKGTDFQAYTLKIGQHLQDNGMDTVLHVPTHRPNKNDFSSQGISASHDCPRQGQG